MLQRLKLEAEAMNVFASLAALIGYVLFFTVLPDIAFAQGGGGGGNAGVQDSLKTVNEQLTSEKGLILFLSIVFYLVGIALIGKGLLNAKKQSEGGQGSGLSGWWPIFGPLAAGAMLIALPGITKLILTSINVNADASGDFATDEDECSVDTTDTVGGAICRIYKSVGVTGGGYLDDIIGIVCIIVGIMVVGSAILGAYRLSSGGQGAPKISGIVWRAIGGALLIAFPAAIELLRNSLFKDAQFTSELDLTPFNVVTGNGLDRALTFMVDNIREPMINTTFFVVYIIGAIMIARTLYAMSGINFEQQKLSNTSIISRLIIGGMLMSAFSIYQTVTLTVMGGSHTAIGHTLAYSDSALDEVSKTQVNNILNAALVWVQMVGLIAFFRGFMVLKTSLDGGNGGSLSAGLTHIIAGALCINIPWTIIMIQNTIPGVKMLAN